MRISGTEPSSVILGQTKYFKKLKSDAQKVPKEDKAKRDGVINPQNYHFNQILTQKILMLSNATNQPKSTVEHLLRFWRSDGVLNLNTHFYSVVFDLFCIFRENTHEQQLIQAKILYQCPSRKNLDFVYGRSHFSTGVIFLRVRHVKNRPL